MTLIGIEDDQITSFPHRRMTTMEYVRERAKLRAIYGDGSKEASAKASQALAKLFAHSGWTQEELGAQEGKTQQWVSRRVVFGRFLDFTPQGVKPELKSLTEKSFRIVWERTDKSASERRRFEAVVVLLQTKREPRRSIVDELIAEAADGEWHDPQVLAAKIGVPKEWVEDALDKMAHVKLPTVRAESKEVGAGHYYRIYPQVNMISAQQLTTELGPLVKALKVEGKKNLVTLSPGTVEGLATKFQRLLDKWTK